jgi:hypothetical protein
MVAKAESGGMKHTLVPGVATTSHCPGAQVESLEVDLSREIQVNQLGTKEELSSVDRGDAIAAAPESQAKKADDAKEPSVQVPPQ